jgi:hypothetical protein
LKHKWSAVKLARPGEDNEPNQAPASRPTAVDRFRALSPVSQEALLQQREQRRYVATQMLSCESSDRLTAVLALKTQQKESVCAHHHRGLYLPTLLLSIGTRGRQSSSTRILMKTAGLKSSKFVINFKQRPSPLFPMARIY